MHHVRASHNHVRVHCLSPSKYMSAFGFVGFVLSYFGMFSFSVLASFSLGFPMVFLYFSHIFNGLPPFALLAFIFLFCHWFPTFSSLFPCFPLVFLRVPCFLIGFPAGSVPLVFILFPNVVVVFHCPWFSVVFDWFSFYSPNFFVVLFHWFPSLSHQSFFICISCSCCSLLLLLFLFLLLLLLLTWGMVALKIESSRGVGGEGAAPPPKALGGSRCSAPLPCCCSSLDFCCCCCSTSSSCC